MVNKGDDSKVISGAGSGIAAPGSVNSTQVSGDGAAIRPVRARSAPGKRGFQPVPVEPRHREAARKLAQGAAILPTLIEAGYSAHTAAHGKRSIERGPLARAINEELASLAVAPVLEAPARRNVVINKLLRNIALNRDQATTSLTTLARIENMLQPDTQVGIIITSLPDDAGAAQWADAPGSPDPE